MRDVTEKHRSEFRGGYWSGTVTVTHAGRRQGCATGDRGALHVTDGTGTPDRIRRGSTHCRHCGSPLSLTAIDLGVSPPCEAFLRADQLDEPETFYPLRAMVCEQCWLMQVGEYVPPADIFGEYAYFSSFSTSWLAHAKRYTEEMRARLELGPGSLVVELGSNDGYLLRHFRDAGVPVLGIEPAANVAAAAEAAGIPTLVRFFGREVAAQLASERQADLIVGNNVLAQVPDLDDFVGGIATLLAPDGVLTLEFPHLQRLLEQTQYDTIYHEHFSYFSLATAVDILGRQGLQVVSVRELPTHGGSLRLYARHAGRSRPDDSVLGVLAAEAAYGLRTPEPYVAFGSRVERTKRDILSFLIDARRDGHRVLGYGAPGKANTLLTFCGIRSDLLEFTVDRNPYKHGRFTPGTHIPILPPERLLEERPDYVWILPWNLAPEIHGQLSATKGWSPRCVVAIPEVREVVASEAVRSR